jgi:hypothetical protein
VTAVDTVNREPSRLMPEFYARVQTALEQCHAAGYPVEIFEGYRSPERQDWLYQSGRKRPGKRLTNAKGWNSWHQYGVACDVAFKLNGKWSWDGDFDKVSTFFHEQGLHWAGFEGEKVHFQLTGDLKLKEAYQIAQNEGLNAVWEKVRASI